MRKIVQDPLLSQTYHWLICGSCIITLCLNRNRAPGKPDMNTGATGAVFNKSYRIRALQCPTERICRNRRGSSIPFLVSIHVHTPSQEDYPNNIFCKTAFLRTVSSRGKTYSDCSYRDSAQSNCFGNSGPCVWDVWESIPGVGQELNNDEDDANKLW
jgi:hypothetical protein